MSQEQGIPETQDFQLFSKRFEQLIKHKNHIIDVLQEELQQLRSRLDGALTLPTAPVSEQVENLKTENHYLRAKLEELKAFTATEQSQEVHRLEEELQALKRENGLLLQELKSKELKLQERAEAMPDRHIELLEQELREKREEMDRAQIRLGELLVTQNRADLTLREQRQQIQDLSQEVQTYQEASKRDKDHIEGKNEDIIRLQKESERFQLETEKLRDNLRELQERLTAKDHLIKNERGDYKALQDELASERAKNAEIAILKAKLEQVQERETQQEFLVQGLRGNLASLNDRFTRFIYGNKDRKTVFREDLTPDDAADQRPFAAPEFTLLLPFCFPEHPPRLLPVVWSPLRHKPPELQTKDHLLRVYKPIPFIKTYLQVALPPPASIRPRLKLLSLELTSRPAMAPEPSSRETKIMEKVVRDVPSFRSTLALLSVVPTLRSLPPAEGYLSLKRVPLEIFTASLDLFTAFLLNAFFRTHHQQVKYQEAPGPRLMPKRAAIVRHPVFPASVKLKKPRYSFFSPSVSKLPGLMVERRQFPHSFPRGGISMLVKGVSDSLSALNSRLELPDLTNATQKRHNAR